MGYRTRICKMPKEKYEEIKSMDLRTFHKKYDKDSSIDFDNESIDEILMNAYISIGEFSEELFEFGKYTNHKPPEDSIKQFFEDSILNEIYDNSDTTLKIVNKDFVKYIIDSYREKIKNYYTDMITPFYPKKFKRSEFLESARSDYDINNDKMQYKYDFSLITQEEQNALQKMFEHIRTFSTEWTDDNFPPYNLDKGEEITTSWKFEYTIFELVRIYKEFDSKKEVFIYQGS